MIDKAQKITQGTRSMLHLKDDIPEYLKQKKVKDSIEFTLNKETKEKEVTDKNDDDKMEDNNDDNNSKVK
eukprot:CAMPEP_0194387980 /NCGR_PEP_ID=MMETSP0174-20130528/95596_1 /TAXON_ID=216777 /ORGANISM="Proboscia alata, Strain PI-D3" /LENGTH=69 /DNA_ID=CAMNT_0039178743 /DNA_START=559 /DNA_END=769 /DNA_ORIENTATION=-